MQQKITTCLWFDGQAEEAADFYTSVFKNSKVGEETKTDEATAKQTGLKKDSVLVKTFEIEGRKFMALNGGPMFKFNEAVSLVVHCEDQKEIDYFWNTFTKDGGQESQCGWLKDKFGLSWQIVPKDLEKLMKSSGEEGAKRAMAALMTMKKLIIADLEKAAAGK
jgi:predicted 3-demethylubiquinone-9 3-methyltransferase (glyoxalase superfamily)